MPIFDPEIVQVILAGALGLTVLGVTQVIKNWLKATGVLAVVLSLAVSGAATAYYLISNTIFTIPLFLGYTFFVFITANGIYKSVHK